MQSWGAARYGDPCRECSFDWSISPADAISLVAGAADEARRRTADAAGGERRVNGGWSLAEYVSHMADNLRNWAERVQSARLDGVREVAGYDPDALAQARRYDAIPLSAALWSLGVSASMWADVLTAALAEGVTVDHEVRGRQSASDIARNNGHDVWHHLWDIETIVRPGEADCAARPGG